MVTELAAALDREVAPALCDELARIYDFASVRLVEANARFETGPLDEATRALAPLYDAFRTVVGGR